MVRKVFFVLSMVVISSLAFSVPVFADEPDNPGSFGQWLAEEAQNEYVPGLSYEIFVNAKSQAELQELPMGKIIVILLGFNGVPPAHTP